MQPCIDCSLNIVALKVIYLASGGVGTGMAATEPIWGNALAYRLRIKANIHGIEHMKRVVATV